MLFGSRPYLVVLLHPAAITTRPSRAPCRYPLYIYTTRDFHSQFLHYWHIGLSCRIDPGTYPYILYYHKVPAAPPAGPPGAAWQWPARRSPPRGAAPDLPAPDLRAPAAPGAGPPERWPGPGSSAGAAGHPPPPGGPRSGTPNPCRFGF